jgi:hypothetical protein
LANVNSSAITARHPDVPNLICVSMIVLRWIVAKSATLGAARAESSRLRADGFLTAG